MLPNGSSQKAILILFSGFNSQILLRCFPPVSEILLHSTLISGWVIQMWINPDLKQDKYRSMIRDLHRTNATVVCSYPYSNLTWRSKLLEIVNQYVENDNERFSKTRISLVKLLVCLNI